MRGENVTERLGFYPLLRLRRRQLVRLHQTLEVRPFVRPITEGLALRQTAPAQSDLCPSCQAVRITFLIHNLNLAIY